MKLTTFIKAAALSTTMTLTTACTTRGPIHKIKPSAQIEHSIDSLKEIAKIGYNKKTHTLYGVDTVEIGEPLKKQSQNIIRNLNKLAKSKSPETITGTYTTLMPVSTGKSVIMIPQTQNIYTDNYIHNKTIIGNGIFADKKGRTYIPVEFYGDLNPEIKK